MGMLNCFGVRSASRLSMAQLGLQAIWYNLNHLAIQPVGRGLPINLHAQRKSLPSAFEDDCHNLLYLVQFGWYSFLNEEYRLLRYLGGKVSSVGAWAGGVRHEAHNHALSILWGTL